MCFTKDARRLVAVVAKIAIPSSICQLKGHVSSTLHMRNSVENAISRFLFVLAVGIGLTSLKVDRLENLKAPELKTSASGSREDVLSAADALQWRQEFFWHRQIVKMCPNAWVDGKPCLRTAKRL